ncbi:DUF4240 domain-containing protein [Actinospica robiniae]|uniref:DUF4240 domain-containing protein n=1 Tax=Actinospica robiniae TaxID=304901 RepID=UPI0004156315|nr:DUF4240 domain-containing protein [Actinospica robiniae]
MEHAKFWALIDDARREVGEPRGTEAVASQAAAILAGCPEQEIVAAQQSLWDLMTESYTTRLWGAAYEINGGRSDDLFDYFRGWLIVQGRATYERVVSDPDSLADVPEIQRIIADEEDVECETALSIAWTAYITATGVQMPDDAYTIRYRDLEPGWDFDDEEAMQLQLPRLTALTQQRDRS